MKPDALKPSRDDHRAAARNQKTVQLNHERRSQLRALLYLAAAALLFTILRAGIHQIFTTGWWRP